MRICHLKVLKRHPRDKPRPLVGAASVSDGNREISLGVEGLRDFPEACRLSMGLGSPSESVL